MSFRLKTICGIAAIEALLLFLLIAGNLDSLRLSNQEQLAKRAAATAELFAAVVKEDLLTMNLASLHTAVTQLTHDPGVVMAQVASSRYGVVARCEDASNGGDATVAEGTSQARANITEGGTVYGWVEVGLSDASIQQLLAKAKHKALLTGALGMLLSAIFSWMLGTYLTRQLGSLTEASRAIAGKRFGYRVPVTGRDELGRAAEAFNRMSEELSRTYARLTESAENFQAFFDTVDAYLLVADDQGNLLSVNRILRQHFAYDEETLEAISFINLFAPSARQCIRRGMDGLSHGENVVSLTVPMLASDGGRLLVDMRIRRGLWNGQGAFFAFGKDVSALCRSEERFRSIADFTYDWEYWLAPNARFEWIAPACQRITGYGPQRFLDDPGFLESIIHPDDKALFQNHMDQTANQSLTPCTFTFRIQRADGEEAWIEHNCRPIYDAAGTYLGRRGCNRDVTERRRAEDAIATAMKAAEAANQAKSQFLATVSHEVRTPLNGIMGMLQLLSDQRLSTSQREVVGIALDSSRRLLTLLNDILDIARIESGKVVLCHEHVDPTGLLPTVAAIFTQDMLNRGLSCAVETAPDMPRLVVTDEGRLRQILFNLIGNAVKFTKAGGIRVWGGSLPVATPHGGVRLLFTISDTGPGIADDKVESIFNRFSQVDDGLSRQYGGLGLGLSIVQRFVALLGGCVCVESELGKGSTFYVTVEAALPSGADVANAAGASTTTTAPPPATDPGPLAILVVEDERINQITLRKFLEKMGHRPTVADNGRKALELLAEQCFDVVLMDIQMPVMDGEETTRRVRAMPGEQAHVPIIALTAHAMKGDREQFLDRGMDGYLSKPVDYKLLEQTIAEVASLHARSKKA